MSMLKQLKRCYPYQVSYPREPGWWGSGNKWYQMSTWCNERLGKEWEYYDEQFMFKTEKEKVLFILRWK